MLKSIAIFSVILSFVIPASAGSFFKVPLSQEAQFSSEEDYNRFTYEKTVTLCTQIESNGVDYLKGNVNLLKFFARGMNSGFNLRSPDVAQLSTDTTNFLRSDGFRAALYKCYPDQAPPDTPEWQWHPVFKRQALFATVIADDIIGHAVAFYTYARAISFVIKLFRVSSFALEHPQFFAGFSRLVKWTAGTLAIGGMGYLAYDAVISPSNKITSDSIETLTQQQSDLQHSTLVASWDALQQQRDAIKNNADKTQDPVERDRLMAIVARLDKRLRQRPPR